MTSCRDCGRIILAAWGARCWKCTAAHVLSEVSDV
ncbi:hypothetical protein SEA_RAVENCO17_58 [Gordonia phage RavenCo17]|nr:hypothetical protein SEA_RAVENCO17_58 [Gordonia phage RavenCo17]